MLTVTGSVGERKAVARQLNLRYFELRTSVYDPSKPEPITFSINCYLVKGKRWEKVNVPNTGSNMVVTRKVAGRTTLDNRLAVRVLDMSFLPRALGPVVYSPSFRPDPKRTDRWSDRVPSVTPPKRYIDSISGDNDAKDELALSTSIEAEVRSTKSPRTENAEHSSATTQTNGITPEIQAEVDTPPSTTGGDELPMKPCIPFAEYMYSRNSG